EAIANLRVDGIATDPPYNIQSAPRGAKSLTDLLISFIDEASNVLRNGRYMVFATPIHIGRSIENALSESGFKIIEKHLDMVHGSLTRAIYVVKKI
ncbi:MAG: RNA methyltransferase, partial [Ignisphaera sp.]